LRNDNAERFYIDGQGKGHPSPAPHPKNKTWPFTQKSGHTSPIPKTKPGRLHKSLDTPVFELPSRRPNAPSLRRLRPFDACRKRVLYVF
jgi:hypothetical protein